MMKKAVCAVAAIVAAIAAMGIILKPGVPGGPTLELSSSAFEEGSTIPPKYTADGADISPPLSIKGADNRTVTFALIMDDPDAPGGTFTHWLIWNIPAENTEIPENVPSTGEVQFLGGARQGLNDFGEVGYGGPSPPSGETHRYRFNLFALDSSLPLGPGTTREQLEKAMEGHILAQTTLTGRYGR